jgi:hypothetical protein
VEVQRAISAHIGYQPKTFIVLHGKALNKLLTKLKGLAGRYARRYRKSYRQKLWIASA